jgi:hypothetical protein
VGVKNRKSFVTCQGLRDGQGMWHEWREGECIKYIAKARREKTMT